VPFGYHRIDPIKDSLASAGFIDLRITVLTLKIPREFCDFIGRRNIRKKVGPLS
jgi:hypothetical protein